MRGARLRSPLFLTQIRSSKKVSDRLRPGLNRWPSGLFGTAAARSLAHLGEPLSYSTRFRLSLPLIMQYLLLPFLGGILKRSLEKYFRLLQFLNKYAPSFRALRRRHRPRLPLIVLRLGPPASASPLPEGPSRSFSPVVDAVHLHHELRAAPVVAAAGDDARTAGFGAGHAGRPERPAPAAGRWSGIGNALPPTCTQLTLPPAWCLLYCLCSPGCGCGGPFLFPDPRCGCRGSRCPCGQLRRLCW